MYRGPCAKRIGGQFQDVGGWAGEAFTWRAYVSASSATSGYYAGVGTTRYYREQTVTGVPWTDMRQLERLLPGGIVIAGDVMLSVPVEVGAQDEIVWRGVTYHVAGEVVPIRFGSYTWYVTPLNRGDATG